MEKASNQTLSVNIPTEKQKTAGTVPSPSYVLNSIWRPSPNGGKGGSNLFDSYELQAVTKQLNRAIQGPNGDSSPYSIYLKSPFYRKRLNRICRENTNTPKMISCTWLDSSALDIKTSARCARGFVLRLWKKVKHGFIRSK